MNEFEEYLTKLNENTNRTPKNDTERGFQIATKIIYTRYTLIKQQS